MNELRAEIPEIGTSGPTNPRVSIGLPVFNGARFLSETLESLLSQSFEDFELIISDNGSTDLTSEICQYYAGKDPRIRYYRNEVNRGASWNYNRVFELAHGVYFKWAAADDVCRRNFLAECISALDGDSSAVLACTDVIEVDEHGVPLSASQIPAEMAQREAWIRFRRNARLDHPCYHVFGVVRSSVLGRTDLIGQYSGSDRILLGHLALFGRFVLVPEALLLNRNHPDRSVRAYRLHSREACQWFDPFARVRLRFPVWREFLELCRVIPRSPTTWLTRARCYWAMLMWLGTYRRQLLWDLKYYPKEWVIRNLQRVEAAISYVKSMRAPRT